MKAETTKVGRLGFTLIELLAVIAIVTILSAILIPMTARIQERGLRVKGASNLRQLGVALQLYLSDNNGVGPPGSVNPHFWRANSQFVNMGSILPYLDFLNDPKISTPELLLSPGSNEKQYEKYKAMGPANSSGACTYYMNQDIAEARVSSGIFPASRVVFHDSAYWWDAIYNGVDNWSGEGMYVVRIDGSVSWIGRSETSGMTAWDYSQLDDH
ncbi:type II secretion system protein [Coraliomargarita sp. SDUM461004]|uniref:Type II secretion system protein n=1 Tax=Thalassobacterium sedimentorum TaxID=3041258 RepID=A0ABU1ALM5_9BACT|nr:type II secretion system protein [Coraliomargarita sp. SDUM461004]MDQ8195707.1 type II secretion system protein [Coraliomargarita sp. SDUM461004]